MAETPASAPRRSSVQRGTFCAYCWRNYDQPHESKRCRDVWLDGSCGLVLEGVMGYVCTRHPCPVGLGGPTC